MTAPPARPTSSSVSDGADRVAIDLGGTKIRAARLAPEGRLQPAVDVATPTKDLSALLDAIMAAVERCDDRGGATSKARIVGLGMPGVVDRHTGLVTRCQNIPAAEGTTMHELLAGRLSAEVRVDNDVNLAALGERVAGQAAGTDDLVVLSLGTGVGAGIISHGQLLRGSRGLAAEIADLPLFGDPWDATDRHQGTLERAIGSVGLLRAYHASGGSVHVATVEELVVRADADAVLSTFARQVAVTILALQALVDPAVVVLTGGIGAAPSIVARVRSATRDLLGSVPEVQVSTLGAMAGLHGAAALALGTIPPWVVARPEQLPGG